MLGSGAVHEGLARGVECLNADYFWLIEENAIGNDFGFETGGAEFLRNVFRGLAVLGCGSNVRLGGECLQVFASELCVWDGKKLVFNFGLAAEIGVTKDGRLADRLADLGDTWIGAAKS